MKPGGSTSLTDDDATRLFGQLSAILTGDAALAAAAVRRHLKTLQHAADGGGVAHVLQRFRDLKESQGNIVEGVRNQLVNDASLGPLVKNILLLWFTGQIPPPGTQAAASQDDYFEALMWSAVGAHPPGLSDAYFGHWRYPPDEGGP